MLRWGDRFVTCIADKLNLSKTTVTIILAVVILLLVVFVITMVIVFHRSENAGVKIPYTSNPNGSNDRLISAQTVCIQSIISYEKQNNTKPFSYK